MTLVNELTWGVMADVAILTVGVASGDMIQPMVGLIRKGGRVVLTAVSPMGATDTQLHLAEMTLFQKNSSAEACSANVTLAPTSPDY